MSALPVVGYLLHCQGTSSVAECSRAVPQCTGLWDISPDVLSCSWQAAPGQCWGRALPAGSATGVAVMCVPLCPAGTNPHWTLLGWKRPNTIFMKHIKWFRSQAKFWARRHQVTRKCSQYCLFSSLTNRKSKFFLKTRSKIPGTSIYKYSYHGQEKRVLRRVVSTSLEFLPTHQRHSLPILEIYWWEHDLKHSKSINNERILLIHIWVIVKVSAGKAVSISTQSPEDKYPLRAHTPALLGVAVLACQACCAPGSPPSHAAGALCGWGGRQQVPLVFLSYTTRKSQPVTQAGITGVANLPFGVRHSHWLVPRFLAKS